MKRLRRANARCNSIRRLFTGEPLLAALYREMGRFDEAIALYEKAEISVVDRPFGLAITYARMNRPDEARELLRGNCRARELHAR